jgi:hypothetical protein
LFLISWKEFMNLLETDNTIKIHIQDG